MTTRMERRCRELRSRVLVRGWGYRQRRHARGVWFRLRRVLAETSEAYAVPAEEARRLVAEGYVAEPVGLELEPPKLMLFVPAARVARIPSTRPLAVRLSAELLETEHMALVPFAIDRA
jgi:hypothetical protein